MKVNHILNSAQFDRAGLDYLYHLTNGIRRLDKSKEGLDYLRRLLGHKRAMLYFTQPSTRTFLSFDSACHILGICTSHIRDPQTSSERKGESIEDSLRTFSSYVDVIVMRTPVSGLCEKIAALLDETPRPVPIINAGSGPDEHPTQALLDIYTLGRSFHKIGGIDGKSIVMVGDLKRGRTIRSLCGLLCHYQGMTINLVSPEEFRLDPLVIQKLRNSGAKVVESDDLQAALKDADAIYMTRVQDEYDIAGESRLLKNYQRFHLRKSHLAEIKDTCIIMHPFPRRDELDIAIDTDPRAKYWRQERNGMWTRVALLTQLLGADQHIMLPEL